MPPNRQGPNEWRLYVDAKGTARVESASTLASQLTRLETSVKRAALLAIGREFAELRRKLGLPVEAPPAREIVAS